MTKFTWGAKAVMAFLAIIFIRCSWLLVVIL